MRKTNVISIAIGVIIAISLVLSGCIDVNEINKIGNEIEDGIYYDAVPDNTKSYAEENSKTNDENINESSDSDATKNIDETSKVEAKNDNQIDLENELENDNEEVAKKSKKKEESNESTEEIKNTNDNTDNDNVNDKKVEETVENESTEEIKNVNDNNTDDENTEKPEDYDDKSMFDNIKDSVSSEGFVASFIEGKALAKTGDQKLDEFLQKFYEKAIGGGNYIQFFLDNAEKYGIDVADIDELINMNSNYDISIWLDKAKNYISETANNID